MTTATVSERQSEPTAGTTAIRPFRVDVPEMELVELRRRIVAARLPERETVRLGPELENFQFQFDFDTLHFDTLRFDRDKVVIRPLLRRVEPPYELGLELRRRPRHVLFELLDIGEVAHGRIL